MMVELELLDELLLVGAVEGGEEGMVVAVLTLFATLLGGGVGGTLSSETTEVADETYMEGVFCRGTSSNPMAVCMAFRTAKDIDEGVVEILGAPGALAAFRDFDAGRSAVYVLTVPNSSEPLVRELFELYVLTLVLASCDNFDFLGNTGALEADARSEISEMLSTGGTGSLGAFEDSVLLLVDVVVALAELNDGGAS